MNELIKITYNNDRPAVSARDLHDFLEVKTAYKDWFPRMCEYGFTEGEDFNPLKIERVQKGGTHMTVEEMLASDKPVLTPADIAPVLGRKPYSISIAAKDHPEQLGFPVSRIGTITVIPRLSFLKFLGYEVEA